MKDQKQTCREAQEPVNPMERQLLFEENQEKILDNKALGKRLVLERRASKIKENPYMKEQLLWDIKSSEQTSIDAHKPKIKAFTHSTNPMERKLLLEAYQEEIRFLCNKAFGNRLILDQKIQKVKDNLDLGEQLLWDLAKNPQSISDLAGIQILGIRNHTRKEAKKSLKRLHSTVEDFIFTIKRIQEDTSQSSQMQEQHQQARQEKTIQNLSNREITHRIQQNPSVKYVEREVKFWSEIVYGNPFIFQYRIEDMQKIPAIGEELVFQIERDRTYFSPLAGREIFGIKTAARKTAEEHIPTLCTAIKDYADIVQQTKDTIVQNHQIEQQRSYKQLTDLNKKNTIPPLSNYEITRRVQQDPSVKHGEREVKFLSHKVYKDPLILQYKIDDIHKNPEVGKELISQMERNPTHFSPLAGRGIFLFKNAERIVAEEHLPTLCSTIRNYVDTVQQVRNTIVKNHQIEQQSHQLPIYPNEKSIQELKDVIEQMHKKLTDLDKKLQKYQGLQVPEQTKEKRHQEISETSKQEEQLLTRSHRAKTSKVMALS
ncbi:BID domain-containing T4SS effector [Bartonella tribocorum]|uniref:BID domain-containing T4SS effector n=1 Tax=Bartonella tribocorum TaxID=85701 RepID=UPI001ABADACD|nr:BID domain-containing T4SS effector [Bartonella tribocorum]